MFGNPVLFSGFGIQWKLAVVGGIVGGLLLLTGGLLFAILFKHTGGQVRRLDPAEAGRAALYGSQSEYVTDQDEVIKMDGVGVGVQLSANIDTLRNAARRGDWLTFWLWPLMMSCWMLGFWTAASSVAEGVAEPTLFIIFAAFFVPVLLIVWFMPWAAIYTKIDLGADESGAAVKTESGGTGSSLR